MDKKTLNARLFCLEVVKLAKKKNLPVFVVTDGASATSNSDCEAVRHARNSHIEWEKQHGFDPEHDWGNGLRKTEM